MSTKYRASFSYSCMVMVSHNLKRGRLVAYRVELIVDAVDVVDDGESRGLRVGQESVGADVVGSNPHAVHSLLVGNVEDGRAIGGSECLVRKEGWNLVALNIRKRRVDGLQVPVDLLVGTNGT